MAPNRQRRGQGGSFGSRMTNSLRRRKVDDRTTINPFVKYFLFFVNFILLMAGIAVVSFSTYILIEKNKTVSHFIYFAFDPVCWMCLLGAIVTVLNFFGAYGALRENILFLKIYYTLFTILLLVEIVLIVMVFVFFFVEDAFADMGLYPEDTIKEAVLKYRDDDDMRGFIDDIQELLSCCGYSKNDEGYKDWNDNKYFNCNKSSNVINPEACAVPHSCCKISEGESINYQCGANMQDETDPKRLQTIYTRGCLKGLDSEIKNNIWIIGGIIIGVFFVQIVFIWFGKALVSQIEEQMMKWY